MDQLGRPVRAERTRGVRAGQSAAVALTMAAAVLVAATGGWALRDGAAVERLVTSAQVQAPEPPAPRRSADDPRAPLRAALPTPAGPAVSTTAATSVVLVDGPLTDVAGTERAMVSYRAAAAQLVAEQPACRLSWGLLAGIGLVESGHGTVFDGALDAGGKAVPPILGPRLDGNGFALIVDTDGGLFDGDTELDRAAGPMQFIPGTWKRWGADADGDGVADPQDIDDAALAAGRYLCASGGRLDRPAGLIRAVFSYNHSFDYVRLVLTVTARYLGVPPSALGVDQLPAPAPEPAPEPTSAEQPPAEPAPGPQAPPPSEPAPVEPGPSEPGPADPVPGNPAPGDSGTDEPAPNESEQPVPNPSPPPGCPSPTDGPQDPDAAEPDPACPLLAPLPTAAVTDS